MKKKMILSVLILLLLAAALTFCTLRLLAHEQAQNEELDRIESLAGEVSALSGRLAALEQQLGDFADDYKRDQEYFRYGHQWGNGFNWLALGNSITLIQAYGHGVASTRPDNDYFALVQAYLAAKHEEVDAFRYNFVLWEQAENRSSKLYVIDSFLSPAIDLVTLQLGENAADLSAYQEDLAFLIRHIQEACPHARVIVVDDFWDEAKSALRRAAADETGAAFADLAAIRGEKEYQSAEGTVFFLADGSQKTVTKEAETHPGDEGMAAIAEKIIALLE